MIKYIRKKQTAYHLSIKKMRILIVNNQLISTNLKKIILITHNISNSGHLKNLTHNHV